MTTIDIAAFSQTDVTPLLRRWRWVVALGVALVILGVLVLVNVGAAVGTLAILVSLALFVAAIDELVEAERHTRRWPSYVLTAFWMVTGVLALVWPDVTLWALAFVVGIGLIAGGAARAIFAIRYHRALPMWGLALADGLLGIVLGVMALAWPAATVLVLAILLGLWVLFRGVATIMFGISLRRLSKMPVA